MRFITAAQLLIEADYRFAKTMPHNPHWYTLKRTWEDPKLFEKIVTHMRNHSYTEIYKSRPYQMFSLNEYKYWTMGAPIHETILINRAKRKIEADYDKIADVYDGLFSDKESQKENKEIIQMADLQGNVLDIGCGTGLLMDYIKVPPGRYTGIDPSQKMLDVFVGKHPEYADRLINTKFEDFYMNHFDTIVALFGTMNYIRRGSIPRIKHFLKKGGKAFLMYYRNGYEPETYKRSGHFFNDFRYKVTGEAYNNYTIVRITK